MFFLCCYPWLPSNSSAVAKLPIKLAGISLQKMVSSGNVSPYISRACPSLSCYVLGALHSTSGVTPSPLVEHGAGGAINAQAE